MKARLYTVFYTLCLGAISAGLLTGVGNVTRSYREANKQAEKVRNILGVLDVRYEESSSSKQLLEIFEKTIGSAEEKGGLTLYWYRDADNATLAVAVQFAGPGLWNLFGR